MSFGVTPGKLVAQLGGELRGNAELSLTGVGTLESAGPEALAFLANRRYRSQLQGTKAGCVILRAEDADDAHGTIIMVDDPYVYYARAAALLAPSPKPRKRRHPSAVIEPNTTIDPSAEIGPQCVIENGAIIGPGAVIGPGSVVGTNVRIGQGTRLVARVTLCAGVVIGDRCLLHPGAVVGADGFGIAFDGSQWIKVPQLGGVVIGDDVEIGANTTIDRGAIEDTVIENGVKLDNLIQIAHNVRIGAHTVIAGCTGVSGSTSIGAHCMIAGQVGIAGHLKIADGTVVTGKTLVNHSIHEKGVYSGALPMDQSGRWRKNSARFRSLDNLARRLMRLEKLVKE